MSFLDLGFWNHSISLVQLLYQQGSVLTFRIADKSAPHLFFNIVTAASYADDNLLSKPPCLLVPYQAILNLHYKSPQFIIILLKFLKLFFRNFKTVIWLFFLDKISN